MNVVRYFTLLFFRCPRCETQHRATLNRGDVFLCQCGYRAAVAATWGDGCDLEERHPAHETRVREE